MKKLPVFVLTALLSVPLLHAADGNFTSSCNIDSQVTKAIPGAESRADRVDAANGRFQPRPTGAAYALYKQGPVMISPVAPPSYGHGERYLTANPDSAGATVPQTRRGEDRDFGGLKLFGWEF